LSLDEIAERLALPKTTVYYWIADLPLGRPRRENPHVGTRAMQTKYRRLRGAAYAQGVSEFDDLIVQPTFRDFVVLYIAEGSKRSRNRVAICNSDHRMVAMASRWLKALSRNPRHVFNSVPRRSGSR
jgi:AcrR family transcriptional regulator